MGAIVLGSIVLFVLAFIWFNQGNTMMGVGMLVMGFIASSNFYLHRLMMRKM